VTHLGETTTKIWGQVLYFAIRRFVSYEVG
jgi:hypothetical protein